MTRKNDLIFQGATLTASLIGIILLAAIFSTPIMGLVLGPLVSPGGIFNSSYGSRYTDKSITVQGIDDTVVIKRDAWGIPHIYGKNHKDVAFALGYVQATDRLFQMEMTVRAGLGRMAEILGGSALLDDVYYQTLGLEKAAQELLDTYEVERQTNQELDEMMDILDAYVEGVNYEINYRIDRNTLPVEFQLLGFKPTLWSPLKTFVLNRLMSLMLTYSTGDLHATILRDNLFNENETAMQEIFPVNNTYYQIPVVPTYGEYTTPEEPLKNYKTKYQPINDKIKTRTHLINEILDKTPQSVEYFQQSWIGSNNWVANGSKTTTGKPILANDMHLSITLPHIWYEAHLVASEDNLNIYGYTLTGTPAVIVGFNTHVAWGFTNVGPDVVDWYEYIWNGNQYWSGNENKWKTPIERTVTIPVKGEEDHTEIIRYTEDGVIMSEVSGKTMIAMRWGATIEPTYEILALYGINKAHNWEEFNESIQYFKDPAQNVVFADRNGNIALRPTGRMIKRKYFGEGNFIFNGSDPSINKEWNFIPFNELPYALNPSQKYLASANQKSTGPEYQYYISSRQAAGYRGRSINRHLSNAPDGSIDVDFMKDAQVGDMGILDIFAEVFTPFIVNASTSSGLISLGSLEDEALTTLKSWQEGEDKFLMKKELTGPTICYATMSRFREYVWQDEWEQAEITATRPQDNVLEYLVKTSPNSKWFDDVSTSSTVETRDDIFAKAFIQAVSDLEEEFGSNITNWKWGNYHQMQFNHLAGIPSYGKGSHPHHGSGYTLLAAGGRNVRGGPSERMVVDFSNISNSWSVIPGGVSGNPANPHYADQALELWMKGLYHPMLIEYSSTDTFPKDFLEATITLKPK